MDVSSSQDRAKRLTWQGLTSQQDRIVKKARVESTNAQYQKAMADFFKFLQQFGQETLPISEEAVLNYAVFMDLQGTNSRFPVFLMALKDELKRNGQLDVTESYLVRLVAQGMTRLAADKKKELPERLPLPVDVLRKWRAKKPANIQHFTWVRDAAVLAVGLRCMRRPGEFKYFKRKHLFLQNGLLCLKIPKSKTDQTCQGKVVPIERGQDLLSCPVQVLLDYLELWNGESPESPLFAQIGQPEVPISSQAVSAIVKRAAAHAGLRGRFSGHSMRIGGATAALRAGLSLEHIRAVGDWTSDAVLRYLRASAVAEIGASKRMGF